MAAVTDVQAPLSEALEPRLYVDPELIEAEQERIFERTWQLIGHVSALPQPGSYTTGVAGSQPVLVVRDDENTLRGYRNVCRHRGSCLLSGSGQRKGAIRCRYHGWTYKFDGTLIGAPEALQFGKGLNKSTVGLMPARVEELCGLLFVNLDHDAAPPADLVGDLPARLGRYRIPELEWCYVFIYPNTTIDLYPDQVNTWQMVPDGVGRTRDVFAGYRSAHSGPRTRAAQRLNNWLNTLVLKEDIDLVKNVQLGLKTRGYRCGPLSRRERAVAWFADRIRADLGEVATS
jgi:phenylpropionate dioxygenase-like ring-hydroxylating dioxygenase large terminal subunit